MDQWIGYLHRKSIVDQLVRRAVVEGVDVSDLDDDDIWRHLGYLAFALDDRTLRDAVRAELAEVLREVA